MQRCNLVILAFNVSLGLVGYSQEKLKIKHAPASNADLASGVEMYRTYCAGCHDGPVSP
jgi:mono/diheme cytochrome c family protein